MREEKEIDERIGLINCYFIYRGRCEEGSDGEVGDSLHHCLPAINKAYRATSLIRNDGSAA